MKSWSKRSIGCLTSSLTPAILSCIALSGVILSVLSMLNKSAVTPSPSSVRTAVILFTRTAKDIGVNPKLSRWKMK